MSSPVLPVVLNFDIIYLENEYIYTIYHFTVTSEIYFYLDLFLFRLNGTYNINYVALW